MIIRETGNLKYFTFNSFPQNELFHGIFTRRGGVSPSSFSSLNVGETAGDTRENVTENRRRIFEVFNQMPESIYDVWQIHSSNVVYAPCPRGLENEHFRGDAIITDARDVTLFMQYADCVPILIYDPSKKAIALIHAGWQGTVKRVVQNTVKYLIEHFSSDPKELIAGIGPSIGPDHYEIKTDVVMEVQKQLSEFHDEIIGYTNGKTYFNLWRANELLLKQSGVEKIEIAEICTACNLDDWFSYRLEGKKSGRFGVVFGLHKEN